MHKVGVVIPCYGTTDYLEPCLRQYAWTKKIIVMNYLYKESEPFPDDTKEIVDRLAQPNVELYQGDGLSQHEILNMGIEKLQDMDFIFISDADEFILPITQKEILRRIINYDMGLIALVDYVDYDLKYVPRDHHPIVVVRPRVRFNEVRCASYLSKTWDDLYVHHLGFILSEKKKAWKEKKQKITGGRYGELQCRGIVRAEMPGEIRRILDESNCNLNMLEKV